MGEHEICDLRTPGHKPPVSKPEHLELTEVRIFHEEGNIFEVISKEGFKYFWFHHPTKLNAILSSANPEDLNFNLNTGLLEVNGDWVNLSPRPVPNCEAKFSEIRNAKYWLGPNDSAMSQAEIHIQTAEARRFFRHVEKVKKMNAKTKTQHIISFDSADTPFCSCGKKAANLYYGYVA
jgi:hypothetical protein